MNNGQAQSSDSQFLCSASRMGPGPSKSQRDAKGEYAEGVWTLLQKTKYVSFILYNKNLLSSKLQRRTSKIFKQMSRFIGSRSPSQCRSQNQKVYKRFRTLTRIVAEFKKEIGEQPFREAYAQMAQDPKIRFITQAQRKAKQQIEPLGMTLVCRHRHQLYSFCRQDRCGCFRCSNNHQ